MDWHMTGIAEDTTDYLEERPMQSPRLFLLTLGALSLGGSNGPTAETTPAPDAAPPQITSRG